jgi:Domain of unknown function (DUF4124)
MRWEIKMQYFLLFALWLVLAFDVHAQVYKWVDQDGNIQYTDQPPPSGAAVRDEKKLNIKTPPPPPVDSQARAGEALEEKMQAFKERRDSELEAEVKQQAKAAENNKRCVSAQGQLKIFRESPRLTFPDGQGGIVYADDEMRQKKIAEAQKNISAYCL